MLSDILWFVVFVVFALAGIKRPYLALCCVIWIDILKPQDLSFSFLAGKPLSLIATMVFFISLLVNKKELSLPAKKGSTLLILVFMFWLTLSTYFAEFQVAAWIKHDYVIKTLFFSLFIPFVIDTRVKLEAFVGILVASIGYYAIIGGLRTFLGDGAYGELLVQSRAGDEGITETSTLSMIAVFTMPLVYYIYKNSIYASRIKFVKPLLAGLGFACLLTIIGTYARTGLVGLFVLFVLILYYSKHKIKIILAGIVIVIITIPFLSQDYLSRMGTLKNAEHESSALGRIVVWRWTLDYVKDRPFLGGGFSSYQANAGQLYRYMNSGDAIRQRSSGKAFHNIYIEALGESGYVGLSIFLSIIFVCWRMNVQIMNKYVEGEWQAMMARTINIALIVYCVCGMFIGVAYSPWLYYFVGMSASLHNIKNRDMHV